MTVDVCMACERQGVRRMLDFTSPGTRDAIVDLHFPAHVQRGVMLCGDHMAPLWALDGLGAVAPGGTLTGVQKLPYYVAQLDAL